MGAAQIAGTVHNHRPFGKWGQPNRQSEEILGALP